jgi:nitrogen fixation protein FixH
MKTPMSDPVTSHVYNSKGDRPVKPITGRQVFWGFAIFFGVVFAMNGVFMYYALSTYTGLDTTNSYRRGLNYNDRVRAEARQMRLGWKPTIALNARADKVTLNLRTASDLPVPNLIVTALLNRPTTADFDRNLTLLEVSPGRYEASFKALKPGNWIISLQALDQTKSTDKIVYRLRKRLWLKPAK